MSDYESLVQLAEDPKQSSYRRKQAVNDILKNFGADQKTVGLLQKMLGDSSDVHLKRDVIGALKDNVDPNLLPVVKPLIHEEDDYLRRDIIQLLGKIGTKEEIALLMPLCEDSSFSVNYAAKQAVKEIESREETEEEETTETEVVEEKAETKVETSETLTEEVKETTETEVVEEKAETELETPETLTEEVKEATKQAENEKVEEAKVVDEKKEEPDNSDLESKSAEVPKEKTSQKDKKDVKEIHPEKQILPDSLHDNSIFGEKSIEEVSDGYRSELENDFSDSVPMLSSGSNPDKSQNLKEFFDDQYQLALALYRQLAKSQSELPQKENLLSKCRHKLTLLEADKADDLEASEESVVESSKDKKDLEWEVKKAEQAIINLEKENKELLNSIIFMFSSARKDEAASKKDELKKKLKETKKKLADEEAELQGLVAEKNSIQEPILLLRKEMEQLTADKNNVLNKIFINEKEINELIIKVISESTKDQLNSRLSFLTRNNAVAAKSIMNRICSLKMKLESLRAQHDNIEEKFSNDQREAVNKTNELGEELIKSIQVNSATKNEKVSIKASLSFREEESFFSFSNASGSASGSGTATASMTVEELNWSQSAGLSNAINKYTSGYTQLGALSTKLEVSEIDIQSTETALSHYVDYIRSAIESDFGS